MEIYFYLGIPERESVAYNHPSVCLAEGFSELGITCYSDYNHCQTGVENEYLIIHDENHTLENADIVFIHCSIYGRTSQADNLLIKLNQQPKKYFTIFIDDNDGLRTSGFKKGARSCNMVLKCHFNNKYSYPKNFSPWQFGVCNRILNAVSPIPFQERTPQILVNFRAKHQLRDYVNGLVQPIFQKYYTWNTDCDSFSTDGFSDQDILYYTQTGRRHYPQYYQKLSTSKFCACYGGVFAIPVGNYNKYTAKAARMANDILKVYEWDRVRQWDSWRLWETWAAGCCVVHIDLEKYGCALPVMPQNGEHYLGIDIKHPEKIESFLKDKARLQAVAENGRNFVLEHYTPQKIVKYLLNKLQL